MSKDYYVPGAHNMVCDRTGFKIKSIDARREWTGNYVRASSFEERHPQDLIRARKERLFVKNARPRTTPVFLETNEITRDDL